ncbi:DUF4178 domain-containing protein [Bacillus sp. SCS-153A]|uniref:DUF4178 domain-containing protein n=1 Tax=Rossellomorea sedimentorum TaxID=3115294 RepID=UPI003905B007
MSILKKLFGKKEKAVPVVKERNVFTIEVGDIVAYDLEDYEVVGKLTYNDHGFEWTAYQLESPGRTVWLSAEMDDQVYLGIYEKVKLKLSEPLPEEIEYEGTRYYLDESGTARVKGEGRGQNVNGMSCRYFDYEDEEEEKFLSVEIWGSEIEASSGYEINEYEIKIIASK